VTHQLDYEKPPTRPLRSRLFWPVWATSSFVGVFAWDVIFNGPRGRSDPVGMLISTFSVLCFWWGLLLARHLTDRGWAYSLVTAAVVGFVSPTPIRLLSPFIPI
jgi:hypothetical protein